MTEEPQEETMTEEERVEATAAAIAAENEAAPSQDELVEILALPRDPNTSEPVVREYTSDPDGLPVEVERPDEDEG